MSHGLLMVDGPGSGYPFAEYLVHVPGAGGAFQLLFSSEFDQNIGSFVLGIPGPGSSRRERQSAFTRSVRN